MQSKNNQVSTFASVFISAIGWVIMSLVTIVCVSFAVFILFPLTYPFDKKS